MASKGPTQPEPIVIVGMGPGGLTAALEAAKKGIPVIIVENRDYFSRVQRLHGDGRTFEFLDSLRDSTDPDDTKFFEHQCYREKRADGSYADGVVEVKDVQAFLLRKLKKYQNVDIRMGKQQGITAIDPDTQTVSLKKDDGTIESVKFSHVLAADGARRGVTALLNQSQDAKYHIAHQMMAMQPRQTQVGTAALEVKPGVTIPNTPPESSGTNFEFEHMKPLRELGWDQDYFPKVRVFRDEENSKFFFSGEVPKSILRIQNKQVQQQALESWAKLIISIEMGIKPQDIALPIKSGVTSNDAQRAARAKEKSNLRTTAFELTLASADKSAVTLGQGGAFALIGDAYKNANFFYGHGMNDAIQDGRKAIESIQSDHTFDFTAYDAHQARQLKTLNTRMRLEAFGPETNLPRVIGQMEIEIEKLTKMAKKMNDDNVKEALVIVEKMAKPGTDEFNPAQYATGLENLQKIMHQYIQKKMAEPPKKGLLNHFGDHSKFSSMMSEFTTMATDANKALAAYYKFNNTTAQSWAEQLREKVQSQRDNKHKL
ncbi:FAD-dependent monooxygenase [Candidatus Berkiella aquae]|uniref:FAD-dependent monooxygenase n=1 Tax=Candidatus Berkiella aquae TaxID=295108 RepID=A0A0Q9YKN4_9GAMM|nr:FAD-dependent monooxygenase [Candidatus Berkiella aquae]MCS5710616.1 FAD-dependent monooxygenase [Candidatus Berkiella aquae]